ncbi:hypothetical protein KP509_04G045200 [Ceratopteris richardii]|uniref:Uncharacterized protein n=1 Tax=Ceratopteris richardii TaxID=49495 RepID=A0A8T2UZI2_CERRI|nr:hypothetical protein KP509_04G045200 [Ceratopteris richardii]
MLQSISFTFIVGTAVVTLTFLGITCFFLCCYHWANILRATSHLHDEDHLGSPSSSISMSSSFPALGRAAIFRENDQGKQAHIIDMEKIPREDVLPVVWMPGHRLPTFIAVPNPYEPPMFVLHSLCSEDLAAPSVHLPALHSK